MVEAAAGVPAETVVRVVAAMSAVERRAGIKVLSPIGESPRVYVYAVNFAMGPVWSPDVNGVNFLRHPAVVSRAMTSPVTMSASAAALPASSGSCLMSTPRVMAPTVPIPVNIAYAVPAGRSRIARDSR